MPPAPAPSGLAPECLVVRIYRRDPSIAGTVELVASGQVVGFACLRDLLEVLTVSTWPFGKKVPMVRPRKPSAMRRKAKIARRP